MTLLGFYMTVVQPLSWGGFQCVTPLPWVFCGRDTLSEQAYQTAQLLLELQCFQ